MIRHPPRPTRTDTLFPYPTLFRSPWAHERSYVPADPAVRYGLLANGLRYAILRNETPAGKASLWLRVDAGSLMEKENQLGLAHFMEHMAFNGRSAERRVGKECVSTCRSSC